MITRRGNADEKLKVMFGISKRITFHCHSLYNHLVNNNCTILLSYIAYQTLDNTYKSNSFSFVVGLGMEKEAEKYYFIITKVLII